MGRHSHFTTNVLSSKLLFLGGPFHRFIRHHHAIFDGV